MALDPACLGWAETEGALASLLVGGHPGFCLPHRGRAGEMGLQTQGLATSGT